MKIIHCADIHLGSKIEAKFPRDKSEERRRELRASLSSMVDYAVSNGINVILMSGDVFDSDRPLKKDKEFFYSVVKRNPDIDFIYLRGNHDVMESYTEDGLDNLKTFSSEWQAYEYGDVVVSGIEICAENARSFYSSLSLDKTKTNIVMLHGQISESESAGSIKLTKLRNKYIDYLALGHIHSYSARPIDDRGECVYSGCLEGRGFDEMGEKGFVVIDTDKPVTHKFVSNCYRKIEEFTVDISDTQDVYTACGKAKKQITSSPRDIVRVTLVGEVSFDCDGIEKELCKQLEYGYYFADVKSKVLQKFDIDKLSGDISLRGEFLRTVYACDDYTEEQKQSIILLGLRALDGREVN